MTVREALWNVALDQYGYVTLRDAEALDVDEHAVRMLVARRQLQRVAHGVYRFPQLPATARDPYMLAVLWTGTDTASLSHDTALAVRELCDINPDRIHVTVPRTRRIRRAGGDLYVLHHEDLADEQREWWEQIPTVTVATAIGQCVRSGVPSYLLRQALENGRRDGLLNRPEAESLAAALEHRDVG